MLHCLNLGLPVEARNLHLLATFQRRFVRDDPRHGVRERLVDIDRGLPIIHQRIDELVRQERLCAILHKLVRRAADDRRFSTKGRELFQSPSPLDIRAIPCII